MKESARGAHGLRRQDNRQSSQPPRRGRPDAHKRLQVGPPQPEKEDRALAALAQSVANLFPTSPGEVFLDVPQGYPIALFREKRQLRSRNGKLPLFTGTRRAGKCVLQPFHRRNKTRDPGKIVWQEGQRFMEMGTLRRAVMLGQVRAQRGKARRIQRGNRSRDFMT